MVRSALVRASVPARFQIFSSPERTAPGLPSDPDVVSVARHVKSKR